MIINDEVSQYINYIQYVRRYSRHTIIAYRTDLRQFIRFYNQNLLDADVTDVRNFLRHLHMQEFSNTTINRKLEVLRSFYRHCRRWNNYKNNPCKHIRELRLVKRRGSYLTQVGISHVLDSIQPGTNRKLARDLLALELLYQTGCRADELINLKKTDVDLDGGKIRVTGKGNMERLLPICKSVVKLIKKQLRLWENRNKTDFLLVTNKGTQMYPMSLRRLIGKYFDAEVSPHTLRHSFATHLHHRGAPIDTIRELLGHRSLRSTVHYTHLDIEILKEIYFKAHPRA